MFSLHILKSRKSISLPNHNPIIDITNQEANHGILKASVILLAFLPNLSPYCQNGTELCFWSEVGLPWLRLQIGDKFMSTLDFGLKICHWLFGTQVVVTVLPHTFFWSTDNGADALANGAIDQPKKFSTRRNGRSSDSDTDTTTNDHEDVSECAPFIYIYRFIKWTMDLLASGQCQHVAQCKTLLSRKLLVVDHTVGGKSHTPHGLVVIVPLRALTADQMSKIEEANQDCGSVKAVNLEMNCQMWQLTMRSFRECMPSDMTLNPPYTYIPLRKKWPLLQQSATLSSSTMREKHLTWLCSHTIGVDHTLWRHSAMSVTAFTYKPASQLFSVEHWLSWRARRLVPYWG